MNALNVTTSFLLVILANLDCALLVVINIKWKEFENILQTAYKCKHRFEAPLEAVLEFEQEDEWNGLPISTPPYTTCSKCHFEKCVPLDYHSKRGYHHIYKED